MKTCFDRPSTRIGIRKKQAWRLAAHRMASSTCRKLAIVLTELDASSMYPECRGSSSWERRWNMMKDLCMQPSGRGNAGWLCESIET